MKKLFIITILFIFTYTLSLNANYLDGFNSISKLEDIEKTGFKIVNKHTLEAYFEMDTIKDTCDIVTAIDYKYGIVAIFVVNQNKDIVYKTEDLACNTFFKDSSTQPNFDIKAVASSDINKNGYSDIIIITKCIIDGVEFNIGDIIFQKSDMLYRDWRITDKVNRFNMNKHISTITRFVRDGESSEFLYNTSNFKQLLDKGFVPITDQVFEANFEKFGTVKVVPGTYKMGVYNLLFIYLVDKDEKIVWNFQCMRDYDNFSYIKSIAFKDIDGDGWEDFSIIVEYNTFDKNDNTINVTDFAIFYQRMGYFFEDKDFHDKYFKNISGKEVMSDIVNASRAYWGW